MRAIDADALQLAIVEEGQANKRKKYIIGDIWELTGAEIREVINSQPTIQPDNNSENPNGSDVISRQAAIDAAQKWFDGLIVGSFNGLKKKLEAVPPAQPDIIRCKDCKHWIPYDWMFSEMWQSKNIADYPEDDIGCDCSEMAMKANDFCSRAERRTE